MVQGASRESVGHFLEILTYSQRSLCRFLRCSDDGMEPLTLQAFKYEPCSEP